MVVSLLNTEVQLGVQEEAGEGSEQIVIIMTSSLSPPSSSSSPEHVEEEGDHQEEWVHDLDNPGAVRRHREQAQPQQVPGNRDSYFVF